MSPRPGPARKVLTVRLSQSAINRIKAAADEAGVDKSEMVRRMLAYATWKMPPGWKP